MKLWVYHACCFPAGIPQVWWPVLSPRLHPSKHCVEEVASAETKGGQHQRHRRYDRPTWATRTRGPQQTGYLIQSNAQQRTEVLRQKLPQGNPRFLVCGNVVYGNVVYGIVMVLLDAWNMWCLDINFFYAKFPWKLGVNLAIQCFSFTASQFVVLNELDVLW